MIDELCTIEMENKWDFCIYLFFAPECLQMLTMKKKKSCILMGRFVCNRRSPAEYDKRKA